MPGVTQIGLDPITAGTLQLRGRRDLAPDPDRGQVPSQAVAGRARLVGHRPRARQPSHPLGDNLVVRDQSRLDDLTRDRVEG